MEKVEVLQANSISPGSYAQGMDFNSLYYKMGGRKWIATAIPYAVLGVLIRTTEVKTKNSAISKDVVNRFLDKNHKNNLKKYIVDNKDGFVIPPITLVSPTELPFKPVTFGNESFSSKEELFRVLDEVGSLMGKVTIPLGYTFTCLDGNHRAKAIAELASEDDDVVKGQNMLVNIVYETDKLRIRQDFVDINKNAKVTTSTINTLFNSRDPLARLTSQVIDHTPYLSDTTELFGASISKNSKKLYTLNNIKNAIVELTGFNSQNTASIRKLSECLKDQEFAEGVALATDVFFDLLRTNNIIKRFLDEEEKRISIRNNALITSGVGLIIVCNVINKAMNSKPKDRFEEIVKTVLNYDWSRDNDFFIGKILSGERNIISNVTSLKETSDAVYKELFPELN